MKAIFAATVTTLENVYKQSCEPEALGLAKALSTKTKIDVVFLLDYTLPQVAKLSKAFQSEQLDLSVIASLVDATFHTKDDAALLVADRYWKF